MHLKWPTYEVAPDESVYALGVVSINYARFERTHVWMLAAVSNMKEDQAAIITARTNASERVKLIDAFFERREWEPEVSAAIKHYLKAMNILIQSRNVLIHSNMVQGTENRTAIYSLSRAGRHTLFQATLEEIRAVADGLETYFNFGHMLANYLATEIHAMATEPGMFAISQLPQIPRSLFTSTPTSAPSARQMSEWLPGLVLPNIHITEPVNAGSYAFAPAHDPRVQEIMREDADFALFLSSFTDAFGMQLSPTVFIVKADLPRDSLSMTTASTLRDCLSASVIPNSHARMLIYERPLEFGFSDAFDLYPWMPGTEADGGMTAQTPAFRGYHVVREFHGQSSPLISVQHLQTKDIDWTLFNELLVRWRRRFGPGEPLWEDIALFRSLDMANAAAKIPAGRDMTEYSTGRVVANWISAFEILVHPGPEGRVGLLDVYCQLEAVKWTNRDCSTATHPAHVGKGTPPNRILPCWIYGELYRARNDFAHGNPVDANRLRLPSGRYLHYYAAPLYRMALTGFLNLKWERPASEEYDSGFPEPVAMWDLQPDLERALATVHKPPRSAR